MDPAHDDEHFFVGSSVTQNLSSLVRESDNTAVLKAVNHVHLLIIHSKSVPFLVVF